LNTATLKRGKLKVPLEEGLWNYKQDDQDRWLLISTVAAVDKEDEEYTPEAIDFGIDWCKEHDIYPELRVIHVRGLRAGKCDKMMRVGPFAVDEGYYDDTPFGKETQRVVSLGKSKVSRGFSILSAAGKCPSCEASLTVGAIGLKYLFQCPECEKIHLGKRLKEVRFLKAVPFDLTVTDRPAVPWTVATNIVKEKDPMSREEIIKRLVEAGFSKEVVGPIVGELTDEQLERAKEDTEVWFKELIEQATAAKEDDGSREVSPGDDGSVTCFKCGSKMRLKLKEMPSSEIEIDEAVMDALKEVVIEAVKSYAPTMPEEIEVDLPGVDDRFKAIEGTLSELMTVVKEIAKSEEDRLAEANKELSAASKSRLLFRYNEKPKEQEQKPIDPTALAIPTEDGQTVGSMSEFMGLDGGAS